MIFQGRNMLLESLVITSLVLVGCGKNEGVLGDEGDDLTSSSAVEREVTIKGYIYTDQNASTFTIKNAVTSQVRTAFGPMRIAKISVDDREHKNNVDQTTFNDEILEVVKKGGAGADTGTDLAEGGVNAQGVLKLVNDPAITAKMMDDDMNLHPSAAQEIVKRRPLTTIAAIDAVPYVGVKSLQNLLGYAKTHGYVSGISDEIVTLKRVKRVNYTYVARGLVNNSLAQRTAFSFAMLMGNYQSFVSEIIKDCVEDYEHDQEFASSFWYVWSPNESSCQSIIGKELAEIEKERQGLQNNQIGEKEYARRFLPVSAQLKPQTPPKVAYPEYDRLFSLDDSSRDRLVVYQIIGEASHAGDPEAQRYANDMKFAETFKELRILADQWKSLAVASSSPCNPLSFEFKGQTYQGTIKDLYNWAVNRTGFPAGVSSADRDAFRRAIHDHIYRKWMIFEVALDVLSSRQTKRVTVEFHVLYGTDSGWTVRNYFQEAFKNGDVVLYMGHSYIGSGPQDPNNYSPNDFHDRYQILFFQSCVSFNYYGVDYFDLKLGGSENMDLVTNGIESYVRDGGKSMGQFLVALLDGKKNTWLSILEKTRVNTLWGLHDPNRSVDGEQDNQYDPNVTPFDLREATGNNLLVTNSTAACGGVVQGTIELSALSAGASRVDFLLGDQVVDSDTSAPFSVYWNSTAVLDGALLLTARAFDGAGKSVDSTCTITVKNSAAADLFFDDMESGSVGWTATGLWHLSEEGGCASPAFASPITAWYFGQDASCNYAQGGTASGVLTSPVINGITSASALSFKFFRDVEQASSGSYDRTRVEVVEAGGGGGRTLWSLDAKDAADKAWRASGSLSLADLAGKSIQLRFVFDSVDGYMNEQVGWLIDDVRVSR